MYKINYINDEIFRASTITNNKENDKYKYENGSFFSTFYCLNVETCYSCFFDINRMHPYYNVKQKDKSVQVW